MEALLTQPYQMALRTGFKLMETNVLPDQITRRAVRWLVGQRLNSLYKSTGEEQMEELTRFIESLKEMPIAVNTREANEQHYEVPTRFYKLCLGKNLKYSACYFPSEHTSLDEAEDAMLRMYCERAQLEDGQSVVDLGCGWGSLTLFVAERYPNSKITAISNSATQRAYIEEECTNRALENVRVITADINDLEIAEQFDRVVSIEMFEHMKNYQKLLRKISTWLKPQGMLFVHIFTHKEAPYHFEVDSDSDWMAKYFFTGGTMPSDNLLTYFQEDLSIVRHWRVNGKHYARTSEEWLKKFDANIAEIRPILAETYGRTNQTRWTAYWRAFFIAVAELFAINNGEEWLVSHYLFRKKGTSCEAPPASTEGQCH
ncbi:hypothetical protein CBR_g6365 [Chara braunii]|uniref:Methyltransferase domain-containing protein n=1 Tax=Chara braunii TaxID=69332 RepID=A0A388KJN1_CHABU|nr:hypothetical protein CBR_g6365 [Chara braunii]|eukprot:GBG70236.1 hypothetical protein CBR_g6365 [Chara braunii]